MIERLSEIKWINVTNIKFDNIPCNSQTFDLAIKLKNGTIRPENLSPIIVELAITGAYHVRDGRHRAAAFKLAGIEQIKARVFRNKHLR